MLSDTSVEAAHAVLRSAGCYAPWDVLRAAIEAAERTAWSTDMEAAPRSETILVRTNACRGIGPITSVCRWHKYAGFCVDELREPVAWRPLPLPPDATDTD